MFRKWLENSENQVWYHGTRQSLTNLGGAKQRFGGIHLGSHKAAVDRLENTPSQRKPPGGPPGPCKIYAFQVHLQKPYNTPDNPASEHEMFIWLNTRTWNDEWQKIRNEHDGVYYINSVEDPGSLSLLVFDKSKLKIVGEEEIIA